MTTTHKIFQLHHETSPLAALRIARSKRCMAGPILGDSGLNVLIVDHDKGTPHHDQAVSTGALMTFQWDGPVSALSLPNGYPPNILYDQHPHRGFVPVGTTRHLTLLDIQLIKGEDWASAVSRPVPKDLRGIALWLLSWVPGWESREARRIENEVSGIVRQRPNVSIVFPPLNVYEGLLRKRFPEVTWP